MIIYRFRLTSEDHDDFLRDIEIQPGQSFLDFHEAVLSYANLEKCENTFFYTTDNKFKKQKEISLKLQKKLVRKYDDDLDQVITETYVPHLMKDSLLKNYVEDPHQRMIYEFTGKDSFILFIELFKIIKTEEYIVLPRCYAAKGHLPKKAQVPVAAADEKPSVKPAVPRIPAPAITSREPAIFSEMLEDETEIAEIENHIDEFMEEGSLKLPEKKTAGVSLEEEEMFAGGEEDEENRMESLDEYEDLEDLENKTRHYEGDSDDF
ncbi:MAG: hypothetical protein NTU98_01070 [Bacteroidetes bacterium]|nr:hypothetical protein [Bacteroidota bacterium]